MPKARTPLDMERIEALQRQGLSRRQIAQELGMAESTLRDNLKVMERAQTSPSGPQVDEGIPKGLHEGNTGIPQASSHWETKGSLGIPPGPPSETRALPEGFPQGDLGIPQDLAHVYQGPPQGDEAVRPPEVSLDPPQPDQAETAVLAGRATPPPDRGGPENTEGGPQGSSKVHLGRPLPEVDPGGRLTMLSTQDLQDLQALLAWWRERQRSTQEPSTKLERVTYHVAPTWIEAVRREADLTGESYAAVVNRAFAQYFVQRST